MQAELPLSASNLGCPAGERREIVFRSAHVAADLASSSKSALGAAAGAYVAVMRGAGHGRPSRIVGVHVAARTACTQTCRPHEASAIPNRSDFGNTIPNQVTLGIAKQEIINT